MNDEQPRPEMPEGAQPRLLVLLPLVVFAMLAAVFYFALQTGDPSRLPSALIGRPVPEFSLPPVEGLIAADRPVPGLVTADLAGGEVTIVNVWASWCIPCHQEHPLLVDLARDGKIALYGINYKDDPVEARRFLGRYGNPFTKVGADATGRVAIDWGVYGVPETYVIDRKGRIAYKHVGPLTEATLQDKILPAIATARAN